MNYWQVAAGSEGRDYSADFLKYGIAFMGQGHFNVAKRISPGDRIILKKGKSEIIAAGTVVNRGGKHICSALEEDGKDWLMDFDGWDLPLYLNVEWHKPPGPIAIDGLTRGTIAKVNTAPPKREADKIITSYSTLQISPEPDSVESLSDEEMLKHLIRLGLRPANADDLTTTINRIRLLADYYYLDCRWEDVREHETRTFLIIPFLLALGWSEQQLKIELSIEGGKIDIAGFRSVYKRNKEGKANDSDCVLIIESKGFSQGLDRAHGQGKAYATQFPNCEIVVASNGYCYKAYARTTTGKDFSEKPSAYLNLLRPKKNYPRDPSVDGGLKLLKYLLPHS